jgi:hypothetical protein
VREPSALHSVPASHKQHVSPCDARVNVFGYGGLKSYDTRGEAGGVLRSDLRGKGEVQALLNQLVLLRKN